MNVFLSKQQHVGAPLCLRKRSVIVMSTVVTERYKTRKGKMVLLINDLKHAITC